MPNWCTNTLAIYGPEADVKKFKEKSPGISPWHGEESNILNFHSLIPVPSEIIAIGYNNTDYEWELANWGCKWGACESELIEEWEGHLKYTFDTAWAPPVPFLSKLGPQWPTLIFLLDYEEMGIGFKGITKVHGDVVEDHCVEI
jgi:Ferredoxin-like domain in Api92-like protein